MLHLLARIRAKGIPCDPCALRDKSKHLDDLSESVQEEINEDSLTGDIEDCLRYSMHIAACLKNIEWHLDPKHNPVTSKPAYRQPYAKMA